MLCVKWGFYLKARYKMVLLLHWLLFACVISKMWHLVLLHSHKFEAI